MSRQVGRYLRGAWRGPPRRVRASCGRRRGERRHSRWSRRAARSAPSGSRGRRHARRRAGPRREGAPGAARAVADPQVIVTLPTVVAAAGWLTLAAALAAALDPALDPAVDPAVDPALHPAPRHVVHAVIDATTDAAVRAAVRVTIDAAWAAQPQPPGAAACVAPLQRAPVGCPPGR
eukprot:scaffold6123_cov113-Isochrysis_galbana.AAC.14